MYNGLTTADKGALLDAKAKGYESVVINLAGFPAEVNIDLALAQIAEMERTTTSTPLRVECCDTECPFNQCGRCGVIDDKNVECSNPNFKEARTDEG